MPCANLQHVGEHAYVGDPIEDPERRYAWPIIWADRIKTHARRQPSRAGCHSQRHGATAAGTSAAHAPSRFKELSEGKTAILISHRFSSVRMADRILVLADGKVEAAGTHEELVAQPGRYSELFELQAAGYR